MTQTTGGGVPVQPAPAAVEQDWPRRPTARRAVDSTTDGRRQQDQYDLAVEIPMIGTGASLNVAVAGSLVLYRLAGFL